MINTKLLELKKKLNKRRPKFLRQDYHHRLKVHDDFWRRPKGQHSKMRRREAGKRAVVQIGYRNPAAVRGLHKSGAKFVYVQDFKTLNKINPKEEIAVLSAKLGARKKYEILKAAIEKKINFANVRAEKFITDFEAKLKAKAAPKAKPAVAEARAEQKDEAKPKAEAAAEKPGAKP